MNCYISARNINDAYFRMASHLSLPMGTVPGESRNGDVRRIPGVTVITYERPLERVLFDPLRNANPFFHLVEAIWMLAGSRSVAPLVEFNSRMAGFAEEDGNLWGAYGYRWRMGDQLKKVVDVLDRDPWSRRAVLTMWSIADLSADKRDLPCNLSITFQRSPTAPTAALDAVVFNRSNDILWGMLGANVVHLTFVQEYIAARLGWRLGTFTQVSANAHAYVERLVDGSLPIDKGMWLSSDPYQQGTVRPYRAFLVPEQAVRDAEIFVGWLETGGQMGVYVNPFFADVAVPMVKAWRRRVHGAEAARLDLARDCWALDWRRAGIEWIARKHGLAPLDESDVPQLRVAGEVLDG